MLIKKQSGGIFVNIKDGSLVIKKGKEQEPETFSSIKGFITKVDFIEEEFEGKKQEKAKIYITDVDQSYILQMKTNSGYFRGFCNSLKSGSPTKEVTITPSSKKNENGKKQTTCFVEQDGRYLKHFFTKDFKGDDKDFLPDLDKIVFKGETIYDNTKQVEYWKKWLSSKFLENCIDSSLKNEEEDLTDDDLPF